jgi:predicted ATPase
MSKPNVIFVLGGPGAGKVCLINALKKMNKIK